MPETDADRFRKEAEECRELAAQTMSALDKETWLRLSEEWLKLAQAANNRARARSPLRE